jgi:purine-binding chemotaxis protein CheW
MKTITSQYCTFSVDSLYLGIEVQQIQEVIRYQKMTRVPLATDSISGLINLRGQIVTALDLRGRLGLPPRAAGDLPMNVVVRDGDSAVSLLVDRIGDVMEVDEDAFEPPPPTLRNSARALIRGAYKLPHQLLLVLDMVRLLAETEPSEIAEAACTR